MIDITPKLVALLEDATPAWMTDVLRHAGYRDAMVMGHDIRRVGTGQMGDTYRFDLTYALPCEGAPTSVVCKFPAVDPGSRRTGVDYGIYWREVNFYRELAPKISVATPRIFFADADRATGDYIIVMEDLAPAEQGDQTVDMALPRLELALDEAAKLHAAFWADDRLDDLDWLFEVKAAATRMADDMPARLWDIFRASYAKEIDDATLAVGEAFVPRFRQFRHGYRGPRTIVHNDLRSDNIMFASAHGGRPITLLDWGSIGYEGAMKDIVSLLVAAMSIDLRRTHELDLLRHYHGRLEQYGVRDYSFEQLWRDYGRFGFSLLQKAYGAAAVVKRTPRGDTMFLGMVEKAVAHIIDHDAVAILDAETPA